MLAELALACAVDVDVEIDQYRALGLGSSRVGRGVAAGNSQEAVAGFASLRMLRRR
jgi:hypothetical protein